MASKKSYAEVPPTRTCKCGDKCSYRGGDGPFEGPANKTLKNGPAFYVKRSDLKNPKPPVYCVYCRQHMKGDFVPWSEWARYQLVLRVRALSKPADEEAQSATATITPVPMTDETEEPASVAVG